MRLTLTHWFTSVQKFYFYINCCIFDSIIWFIWSIFTWNLWINYNSVWKFSEIKVYSKRQRPMHLVLEINVLLHFDEYLHFVTFPLCVWQLWKCTHCSALCVEITKIYSDATLFWQKFRESNAFTLEITK